MIFIAYHQVFQVHFLADDHLFLAFAKYTPIDISIFAVQPKPYWLYFHRPFVLLLWQFLYELFGFHVVGYHAFSLVLHWINTLLIVALVRQITGKVSTIAMGTGILFALFPVHMETITWMSALFDLTATTCYLATLLCLLMSWQKKENIWFYIVSLFIFQLGIWSKESVFSLPFIVIMAWLVISYRPKFKYLMFSIIPYGLLISANLLERYLVWGSFGGYENLPNWQKNTQALLNVLMVPFDQSTTLPTAFQYISPVLIGFILVTIFLARPNYRLLFFGISWFVLTLMPVLNLLDYLNPYLSNSRLLYLPLIGLCLILVASFDVFVRYTKYYQEFLFYFGYTVIAIFLVLVVNVQLQPWISASQQSIQIFQEIHRMFPAFRHGTLIATPGVPTFHKGVPLYNNGLDAALLNHHGLLPHHWQIDSLPPIQYNANADMYVVQFDFNSEAQRLDVKQAYGVSLSEDSLQNTTTPYNRIPEEHWIYLMNADNVLEKKQPLPPPESDMQTWHFTDCSLVEEWKFYDLNTRCKEGEGLHLFSQNEQAYMVSLPLQFPYDGWVEVTVRMTILETEMGQNSIRMSLSQTSDDQWNEREHHTINLPQDKHERDYHFFALAMATSDHTYTLKLTPIDAKSHVLLESITARLIR